MNEHDHELLGPAELHIIKKLKGSFEQVVQELDGVRGDLETLSEANFAEAMLDSQRKEAVISLLEVVERLPGRMSDLRLITMISLAIFDPEALKDRRG